jgi:hypothetical protein
MSVMKKGLVCKTCSKPKDEHHEFVPGGYRRTVIVRYRQHREEVVITDGLDGRYTARWDASDGWHMYYEDTALGALRSARSASRFRLNPRNRFVTRW